MPPTSRVTLFQWKLAGLFHDIGYPAEVASTVLGSFTKNINEIKQDLGIGNGIEDVSFRLQPDGLTSLTNGNSLDLIRGQLARWNLNIDAHCVYDEMNKSGRFCHGIMSALALLYVTDLMYHKNNPERRYSDIFVDEINWNQRCFEEDVVPTCSAIFVHNLPAKYFAQAPLRKEVAPLAFLLKLSDTLQEWERPKGRNFRGVPGHKFDILISPNRLDFFVASKRLRKKIREDFTKFLDTTNVKVHPLTALNRPPFG